MVETVDIVVVGAGLIGASLALALEKKTDFKIRVLERSSITPLPTKENANVRIVALGKASTTLLDEIDCFSALTEDQSYPYSQMVVWDEGSVGELRFSSDEVGLPNLGHMIDSQACTHHLQALLSQRASSRLQTDFELELKELLVSEHGAFVRTDRGEIKARLVIGADGASSWVRRQSKIYANRRSYKQLGIVAKIKTAKSHRDTAWQRFLPTGPIAALPVNDNHCSIVWSADDAYAQTLLSLSEAEFCEQLQSALENRLGSIELSSKRLSFPLTSMSAQSYYAPSVALVGDAAHSIHPLAGQGANLGFKDATALLSVLVRADDNQINLIRLLQKYQNLRQADNKQTDWLMTALQKGYSNGPDVWATLRGLGMNWVDDNQSLKSLFARHALGD